MEKKEIITSEVVEPASRIDVLKALIKANAEGPCLMALAQLKAVDNEKGRPSFMNLPSGYERMAAQNMAETLARLKRIRAKRDSCSNVEVTVLDGFLRELGF